MRYISALPIKTTILDPFALNDDHKGLTKEREPQQIHATTAESPPRSEINGFLACISVVQDILLLSACALVSSLALNLMII